MSVQKEGKHRLGR